MADPTDAPADIERRVTVTRLFAASIERVFAAWTEPEQMARWWGPHGFTIPVSQAELRPGGSFRYCMRAADGQEHWVHGTIDDIVPPSRLVTTSIVENPNGREDFAVTSEISFSDEGGRTRVAIETRARALGDEDVPPAKGIEIGWNQSLEKLESDLAHGPLLLTVKRRFAAAPDRVFDAWLDRDVATRFLFATPGGVMERVEIDPRVGGRFLIDERRGTDVARHFGEFVEIDRPRRLVFRLATGEEQAPSLVRIAIEPAPDGCELTLTHTIDREWASYEERVRAGWTKMLDGLANIVSA
jgi:uncharacterized protein YndB with AHSA1/START domain